MNIVDSEQGIRALEAECVRRALIMVQAMNEVGMSMPEQIGTLLAGMTILVNTTPREKRVEHVHLIGDLLRKNVLDTARVA